MLTQQVIDQAVRVLADAAQPRSIVLVQSEPIPFSASAVAFRAALPSGLRDICKVTGGAISERTPTGTGQTWYPGRWFVSLPERIPELEAVPLTQGNFDTLVLRVSESPLAAVNEVFRCWALTNRTTAPRIAVGALALGWYTQGIGLMVGVVEPRIYEWYRGEPIYPEPTTTTPAPTTTTSTTTTTPAPPTTTTTPGPTTTTTPGPTTRAGSLSDVPPASPGCGPTPRPGTRSFPMWVRSCATPARAGAPHIFHSGGRARLPRMRPSGSRRARRAIKKTQRQCPSTSRLFLVGNASRGSGSFLTERDVDIGKPSP